MQWIKIALLTCALCLSFNAAAMTDDEEAVWRDGLTDGHIETVKQYVDADATVVNEKIFGWSPLQMATNGHHLDIVKYLLSKGAKIDYMHPTAEHTAFHLAALSGDTKMMELLEKSGADVNVKLRNDFSLIQYYRDENNTKMIEFLTSLGVKDDGCKSEYC
ncbi:MAG: ankyrin repeat protein [Methylophilaceae bacterium]|jgi:ankyrin repeat protein